MAGESAERSLTKLFSHGADVYERHWAPRLRVLAQPLIDRLPLREARVVVDVGAGTGTLARVLIDAAAGATVVGVDLVEDMLRRAPSAMRRAVMDATALGLRTEATDVVVCAFVLFFVPDPVAALREMRRVLRVGGSLGVAVWSDEPDYPAGDVWNEEVNAAGAPQVPALRHDLVDGADRVRAAVEQAAFEVVDVWRVRHRIPQGAAMFIEMMSNFGGKRRLDLLDANARAACLQRISARLRELSAEDFVDPSEVAYVVARKSER